VEFTMPEKMPPLPANQSAGVPRSQTGALGLVFSALGLIGWLTVLVLLLANPYEAKTGDGQRDMVIGLGNLVLYLFKVGVGTAGMLINGGLSLAGTMVSGTTLAHQPHHRAAKAGVIVGLIGLACGAAIILWRMVVWNAILSQ
jgi:hypothetical protein